MKILIEIPDHVYEHAKESTEDSRDEVAAIKAVANGTPLSKEHGRLIDADKLIQTLNSEHINFNSEVNYFICKAPTIIEGENN